MPANEGSITGGCQCGAATFGVNGDPLMVIQCHCLNCQKSSGAGHVPFAAFPESQVTINGETKAYTYIADSGGRATTNFCPECGSPVYARTTSFPGMVAIRLGSMDDSSRFQPQMDVYMKRLRTWDHHLQGKPAFEAMPPAP